MTTDPLTIAEGLLSLPTAPYHEDLPRRFCLDFAADRGIDASSDAAGNLVLRVGEGDAPTLVLVAHLDHPAFTVDAVDGQTASMRFVGGVGLDAARSGSPLTFFALGSADPCGRGELVEADGANGRLQSGVAAVIEGEVPVGGFAMWGFPGWTIDDGLITARVCDDLLGAAAALACLEVARDEAVGPVWALLTRAEEDGLLGAFEAVRLGTVPRDAAVISLECSKALPEAPQGAGVIVRVGDRLSVFDDGLTRAVQAAAEQSGVRHRRKLMDGGVCEASVFCGAGYRATGLATPLGNYHNAADDGSGIKAETVMVEDWLAEVDLLRALATGPLPEPGPPAWFDERAARAREMLGA
jgi:putative aminopeptidase FrvX